jgi:hypothetical protein
MTDNVVLPISKAPVGMGVPNLGTQVPFSTFQVTALGGRDTQIASAFSVDFLIAACLNLLLVKNTGNSSGASPVLKEFMQESGYVYTVTREIFDDGDSAEHRGGNAIDVASTDLPSIARFLVQVPELFHSAYYTNVDYANESVYIQDGVIVSSSTFPEATSDTIHLSSSLQRMRQALLLTDVRAALGAAALSPFTNRDVYAAPPSTQLAAHEPQGVDFW